MFSGALINILMRGDSTIYHERLTLRELQARTSSLIWENYGDEGVHPEIHSPDQRGHGDIANVRVFPNFGYGPRLKVLINHSILIGGTQYQYIPHTTTYIGSDDGFEHERPRHRVKISSFFLQQAPVTNLQFRVFIEDTKYQTLAEGGYPALCLINNQWGPLPGANWQHPNGPDSTIEGKDDHPVVQISWHDAMEYCLWRSRATGFEFALPTEVQWEYAAAGPQELRWPHGNIPEQDIANIQGQDTSAVRKYPPTSFELFDMEGNVYEWCEDWYTKSWVTAGHNIVDKPTLEPSGPGSGEEKVLKGGSWFDNNIDCRCSHRFYASPKYSAANWGFRCCLKVTDTLLQELRNSSDWDIPSYTMLSGDY